MFASGAESELEKKGLCGRTRREKWQIEQYLFV
jgi:hypothetical protein